MHPTYSVRANWVWTGIGEPISNGCVSIRNDRIVSVSNRPEVTAIDIGDYCILPGLINSHTHLEFSDLRAPVDAGGSFADWILNVVQRRRMAASSIAASGPSPTEMGLIESRKHGIRLALDIVHTPIGQPSRASSIPETIRFAELMSTTELRARQTWRGAIEIKRTSSPEIASFGLSPHAPYTTTSSQIHQAVVRCKRWKVPVMMHLAESLDEVRWIDDGDGPLQELLDMMAGPDVLSTSHRLSIAGYVHELCKAPLAFIVHGNYLDESAMDILEANRDHSVVVYCPRTHAHFGHAVHPLLELRRRGIPVVLGTDSRASNPDLSILEEARKVRQDFHELSAAEILAMITTLPAKLLGRTADWGFITPGGIARLTAIPCHATKASSVLDELLESSYPSKPLESVIA
jgi:aminodeoxyfutalosine deaminase